MLIFPKCCLFKRCPISFNDASEVAMKPITVIAKVRVQIGSEGKLLDEWSMAARASRQEPGCLSYEILRSNDTQNEFMSIELWKDAAAVDSHMASSHVQNLIKAVSPLLEVPPEIKSYSQV